MGLRRWFGTVTPRPFPDAGGWLDQDAELLWALEVIQRAWDQQESLDQVRKALDEGGMPPSSGKPFQLSKDATFV